MRAVMSRMVLTTPCRLLSPAFLSPIIYYYTRHPLSVVPIPPHVATLVARYEVMKLRTPDAPRSVHTVPITNISAATPTPRLLASLPTVPVTPTIKPALLLLPPEFKPRSYTYWDLSGCVASILL